MPSIGNKRLPILNSKELKIIIDACESKRDKALIIFIADSDLRRSELCNLNWGDIDISRNLVRVKMGKGNKSRTVVIGAKTRRVLLTYRRTVCSGDSEPVFQTSTGTVHPESWTKLTHSKCALQELT
jgi:integrase/recombinase XerD